VQIGHVQRDRHRPNESALEAHFDKHADKTNQFWKLSRLSAPFVVVASHKARKRTKAAVHNQLQVAKLAFRQHQRMQRPGFVEQRRMAFCIAQYQIAKLASVRSRINARAFTDVLLGGGGSHATFKIGQPNRRARFDFFCFFSLIERIATGNKMSTLVDRVRESCDFFDRMMALIPAKIYLGRDAEDKTVRFGFPHASLIAFDTEYEISIQQKTGWRLGGRFSSDEIGKEEGA
jgi:hypothetical protein